MNKKERYAYFKSNHICPRCQRKDSRTLSGKVYCISCSKIHSDYMHTRSLIRIENRKCAICGKPLKGDEKHKKCFDCRIKRAEMQRKLREKKKTAKRGNA